MRSQDARWVVIFGTNLSTPSLIVDSLKASNCRTRIVTKGPVKDARINASTRCWFDRASSFFYDTAFKDSKIIKGTNGLSTAHLIVSQDSLLDWFMPRRTPTTPPPQRVLNDLQRARLSRSLWLGSSPPPSTGDTQEDWERETTCSRERGEGGGRGTESFDRKEAWASTNHSILSAPPPSQELVRKNRYCW